jgi:D-inositol-3-phosphate glycosyltransferase
MVSDRASRHVSELSAALLRQDHDVTVYMRQVARSRPTGDQLVTVSAGPTRPSPDEEILPHLEKFIRGLRKHWSTDPPDVVHAHGWISGLAAISAAEDTAVPVVQTFHTLGELERRRAGADEVRPAERADAEKMLGHEVRWIAASSTDELAELVRMGVARARISVVPGGVDLETFVPEGERSPRGKYPHRLVAVGELLPHNGFVTIIAALRALPDTELVIAGGPDVRRLNADEHARFLRSFAADMDVADQVRLLGRVAQAKMPPLLRSADAVVCTPWFEPFGTAALEAMACGVPVVASAVGGLADTVVDGITGRLVPPRKPRQLAGVLRHLLARQAQREQFGAAGRDRASTRYSWDRVAAETIRVYERAGARSAAQLVSTPHA